MKTSWRRRLCGNVQAWWGCQCRALYAPGRFMQELTEMLGFRPYRFYFYMWKFVSPLCMAVLTTASIIQLGVTPPGYSAWIKEEVRGNLKLQGHFNATGNRDKPS